MTSCLEDEIEFTREAMIDAASTNGLSSDETIELSKKLDHLINQFLAGNLIDDNKQSGGFD